MLLPKDFVTRYGTPKVSSHNINNTTPLIIPYHGDRYLLSIWWVNGDVTFIPQYDDSFGADPLVLTNAKIPFILTHVLHGSLVNMAWVVRTVLAPPGADLILIQGVMNDKLINNNGKTNAKIIEKPSTTIHSSIRCKVRTKRR